MQNIYRPLFGAFLLILSLVGRADAQFEEGKATSQSGDMLGTGIAVAATNTVTYTGQGEASKKIKNVIWLKINEKATTTGAANAPFLYFKSPFQATVNFNVTTWATIGGQPSAAQAKSLTVDYDTAQGKPYSPVAYLPLDASYTGFEQVQVTITGVSITGQGGNWNPLQVLQLSNEMKLIRYFTFSGNATSLAPIFNGQAYNAATNGDQLSVSWAFPAAANNNISQLEYAWVEDEAAAYYTTNGLLDQDKVFGNNSTRVDIDFTANGYNIPLLYDGRGSLYYRVRAALRKNDGNMLAGPWSAAQLFAYGGHEPLMNWQSSTSFAENGKSKSVVQYFDGSLRGRQTVTKDNSTGNTVVAETLYDLQGRPNMQILPTPTMATAIQYFGSFNRFKNQAASDDPARYFDLSLKGNQCSGPPQLDTFGNGKYYSPQNQWIGREAMASYIPDAGGYAYSETRFMDDPTQRVQAQGGVGLTHQIGNGHETRYYYGKPAQDELDALFGTEVGDASHYFKNMVQDANGQMSVSYVDMHGRTVATALAGDSTKNLSAIYSNGQYYPQASVLLTNQLLTPSTNIIKGVSIESISTILVPRDNTIYNFTYQLAPPILQQANCAGQQVCYDCKYDLQVSIRQEGCANAPAITKNFNNLQLVPASQAFGTAMGFVGDGVNTATQQISFPVPLGTGSWVVRKTLSINDSMFRVREAAAMDAFLCKSQQDINDSIFAVLSKNTGCGIPAAARDCGTCQAQLGSFSAYEASYLQSIGLTAADLATDAMLHKQYSQDSLACAQACGTAANPAFATLTGIRAQMLRDMTPYTGQYAIASVIVVPLAIDTKPIQAKYNIFSDGFNDAYGFGQFPGTVRPFFQNPVAEPTGTASPYTATDGTADNTIYPNGSTDHTLLNGMGTDGFTNIFSPGWAAQLIFYHPEYKKLRFAETVMLPSYTWLDNMQQCATYAQALARGYLTPLSNDPYFTKNYVPADKTDMATYLTKSVNKSQPGSGYSIWRIANSSVLCGATLTAAQRQACMADLGNAATTGLSTAISTTAQQDAVWQSFRSAYLGFRNDMVTAYINGQALISGETTAALSQRAMDSLQAEGKQLRFATNAATAAQNGWTWWPAVTNATSTDSVNLINIGNQYIAANTPDQCTAQRPFWRARLLQCEQLQGYLANGTSGDTLRVNNIINSILDGMVAVCHNSIDAANPQGASNVAPAKLPTSPSNFEDIVNSVFLANGIATAPGTNYFCNPYSIDFPKPYGRSPVLYPTIKSSLDTCACTRFAALAANATAAGYDAYNMAGMNAFLLANYGDTLSPLLWQGRLICSEGTNTPIKLGSSVYIPPFLSCGYSKNCVSCGALRAYTTAFTQLYPACTGVPWPTATGDTNQVRLNALWARYLNYKTGFSKMATEYAAALLACGSACTTDLMLTDRNAEPPATGLYTAGNSISFMPGYTSLPSDNFSTLIQACTASLDGGAALCNLDRPLAYMAPPDTTKINRCQQQRDEADFTAQLLFGLRRTVLIANFDSLYRARCLSAQGLEVFYATYQPKEYHYTLYYYDQAGNLLKTLPPAAVWPNYDATFQAQVKAARANGTDLLNGTNKISMATQYRQNTLNQTVAQQSPDGGTGHFWYDRLGRMAISQNAKQSAAGNYSYTLYDILGRIVEVGEKPLMSPMGPMTQAISQDEGALAGWLSTGTNKEQITRTVYDVPYTIANIQPPPLTGILGQVNLRNRVSYAQVWDLENDAYARASSYYSYDVHGNVDTLLQDYGSSQSRPNAMNSAGNRFKMMVYDYDLISGKVNQVRYQPGYADGFYHRYGYDAENRLTMVETSRDSLLWTKDANYHYYRHGPLARTELGDLHVQGLDYAYTIHGWLKGVNSTNISNAATYASGDMGADGSAGSLFARDAVGFSLNYFGTDYSPIGGPAVNAFAIDALGLTNTNGNLVASPLYNGNIASMGVNLPKLGAAMLYGYRYDQLNRIVSMDAFKGLNTTTGPTAVSDYKERIGYDPNGNIQHYQRYGDAARGLMDDMAYSYKNAADSTKSLNQLDRVVDAAADVYPAGKTYADYNDIKRIQPNGSMGQAIGNYAYDAVGNLIGDISEGITNINWTVYGKIQDISKSTGSIAYTYDASGNRISKKVNGRETYYVRDATGNVMAVYSVDPAVNGGSLTQVEVDKYGSSRLGVLNCNLNCTNLVFPDMRTFGRGYMGYELTNHLGNVLATVSDKAVQNTSDNTNVAYYTADVLNANDYYPFGMVTPGRSFSAGTQYRYGFNGKENDPSISTGAQDYGMRINDVRLGKFLSVDPISKKYPELTPYQFASNTPIQAMDLDGLEKYSIHLRISDGKEQIVKIETDNSIRYMSISVAGLPIRPKLADFIYEDKNGTVTHKIRNIALSGYGGTLYVGPFNPKYPSNGKDRYDLPAINSLDAAAKKHDLAYDRVLAKGPNGAFVDLKTIDADRQLVKDAQGVVALYNEDKIDPVTRQKVSGETKEAAENVVSLFTKILMEKDARIELNKITDKIKAAVNMVSENVSSSVNNIKEVTKEGIKSLDNLDKIIH